MSGVTSIYPMILENVDDTLYADVEATLPADYAAAGTKYKFLSSTGDVFLSFNVANSNIYKLNKSTKEFDIIGSISSVYPQKWYELPDGTVICAYTGTPARTVLAYNPLTNLLEDFTRLSEYFLADGIETDFTFKLASGTYTNLKVYLNDVLLSEEQEDGVDEHVGNGTVLYLLNRTPSAASPITTDFVVKVNGVEVPNPENTNYSYIWQVQAQRHSIVFPTGNPYIPDSGDVVEIIYDMKNYTFGNYYINFDVIPEVDTEIIIVYSTTIPSTGFVISMTSLNECIATCTYGGIYRFETVYNTFELLSASYNLPFRISNVYGDIVFSTSSNLTVGILLYGEHNIDFYSDTLTVIYSHEGYDGEIFLLPGDVGYAQGMYRFDHSDGSFTQILTSIPSGGVYNKGLVLEPVTNDAFIGSQANYSAPLGCIRYNRLTGVASVTNGSQNSGQEAKLYNGFNYIVGYNNSLYSYWDRTTETWVSMFASSSRTPYSWTNNTSTALLNTYSNNLYAYDTTTETNTLIHAKSNEFIRHYGYLYYYSTSAAALGTYVLRDSLTPVKIADVNIAFSILAPDSCIYGKVVTTNQIARYNPADDSVVLLEGYAHPGLSWFFYNNGVYALSNVAVNGIYKCNETQVDLVQEWYGGKYLCKDIHYLSAADCKALFGFTKKRVFNTTIIVVDAENHVAVFADTQRQLLIFNKEA